MHRITRGKGFHVTFANGYSVSVQWGYGNYCENYDVGSFEDTSAGPSSTAEVAIIKPEGVLYQITEDDTVVGYQSADEVAAWIALAAALPAVVEEGSV